MRLPKKQQEELKDQISLDIMFFLLIFIFSATAKATSMLSYSPWANKFLEPTNFMHNTPTRADDQVEFTELDCTLITLQKLILCPGTCRGQLGLLFLVLYLVFC